jgi:two-component system sensor histidine kinase MprB
LPLLVALAGAGGYVLASRSLAPLGWMAAQARQITGSNLHTRLDIGDAAEELAVLSASFNELLSRLDQTFESMRRFVADASHELRTPIATIRANLQLMREEELLSPEDRAALREDVIEELDELTALVADVVELARGSKPTGEQGDVRLDSIVQGALERARRRAPELTFGQRLEPTLVRGDGDRISRAVTNLLDNAAKWSPEGGTVEVTLHDGVVTVRDHGPGFIAPGRRGRSRGRASVWRSSGRPLKPTTGSSRHPTRSTAAPCCESASARRSSSRSSRKNTPWATASPAANGAYMLAQSR